MYAGRAALVLTLLLPALAGAQEFEGRGSESTRPFPLAAGVAVFEAHHEGQGPFRVRLIDEQGNAIDDVAVGNGPFGGTKTVSVPRTGTYLLDVSATGEWSVRLRANRPELGLDPAVDSAIAQGTRDGRAAAGEPGTAGRFFGGLVAGALTGPIGTVLVARAARNAADDETDAATQGMTDRPLAYRTAWRDAYRDRLASRKQRAAIFGGVVGTGILVFTILQLVDLSGSDSGPPGTGNPPPPAIVVPVFRF